VICYCVVLNFSNKSHTWPTWANDQKTQNLPTVFKLTKQENEAANSWYNFPNPFSACNRNWRIDSWLVPLTVIVMNDLHLVWLYHHVASKQYLSSSILKHRIVFMNYNQLFCYIRSEFFYFHSPATTYLAWARACFLKRVGKKRYHRGSSIIFLTFPLPPTLSLSTVDFVFWVNKNASLLTQITKCKTRTFSNNFHYQF